MNKALLYKTEQYKKEIQRQRRKRKIMTMLSVFVVLFTLNALMLPAITMESETICGMEKHTHNNDCYSVVSTPEYFGLSGIHQHTEQCYQGQEIICGISKTYIHRHNTYCYDSLNNLTCPLAEIKEHSHDEDCFNITENIICTLAEDYHLHDTDCYLSEKGEFTCTSAETEGHSHTDECYTVVSTELICITQETAGHAHGEECFTVTESIGCNTEETAGHTHSDECLAEESVLSCTLQEDENHAHSDECYTSQQLPICEIVETAPHTHTEECNVKQTQLICEQQEIEAHHHGGECYTTDKQLICKQEEIADHSHEDSCYQQLQQIICEKAENTEGHQHTEDCYAAEYVLSCGIEEIILHTHREECYDRNGLVICGNAEVENHTHSDECTVYNTPENPVLICTEEEHQHEESCYPSKSEEYQMVQLIHQGPDYTVTVIYDSAADIPENAVLSVTEILPDSEEYRQYLQQAQQAVGDTVETQEKSEITFARFFDISFIADGQIIEPSAPVEVSISYNEEVIIHSEDNGVAIHFADNGIEVLDAQTNETENKADTFIFIQDSFSVTGTVVASSRAAAEQMEWYTTSTTFVNSEGAESTIFTNGDEVIVRISGSIDGWQYGNTGGSDKVLYITLPKALKINSIKSGYNYEDAVIDNSNNTATISVPPQKDQWGNYQRVNFVVDISCEAINTNTNPLEVTVNNTNCKIYNSFQELQYSGSDGMFRKLKLMGSSYNLQEYNLVIEKTDDYPYKTSITSFLNSNYQNRKYLESAAFNVYLQKKTNSNEIINIPAPYSLNISFDYSPVMYTKVGKVVAYSLTGGNVAKLGSGSAVFDGYSMTGVEITDTNSSLNCFGIASLGGEEISGSINLKYNYYKDSFITNSEYSKYYNENSPIGTAGSFHIVAFDTANLYTHTNGNILAKNLNAASSNFGTNNFPDELSYVQNYLQVNAGSSSKEEHILVVGNYNSVGTTDNNSRFTLNGTKLNQPKNLVVDVDTDNAPFIDIERVKAEVSQISNLLAKYNQDMNLNITLGNENIFSLTTPSSLAVLNVKYDDPRIFNKSDIRLAGFETGYDGSIVINVDCQGATSFSLPQRALVVVDGQVQGTSEVVEFSAGKVLWNFINAEGVEITTHQMTGMIIAPGATIYVRSNLNGTIVADNVNINAESHRTDFTGRILPEADDSLDTGDTTHITIQKSKTGYIGIVLEDARFDLHIWNGNRWSKVDKSNIVTNENGLVTIYGIEKNTAYRLIETQAPAGYILSDKPVDFWVRSSKNVSAPTKRPSGFTGRTLDAGNILNIPNTVDGSFESTTINIVKQWVREITEPPDSITADIYQLVITGGKETSRSLYKTVTLKSTDGWKTTLTDLPKTGKDSAGARVSYLYTVSEMAVPNFTTSYSDNNLRGIDTGTITITNTEVTGTYELPETGGSGTKLYSTGGILLVMAACTLLFYKRKIYREEEITSP